MPSAQKSRSSPRVSNVFSALEGQFLMIGEYVGAGAGNIGKADITGNDKKKQNRKV